MRVAESFVWLALVIASTGIVVADETSRPHLFLAASADSPNDKAAGSVAVPLKDFRRAIDEHASLKSRWKALLEQANHDVSAEVVVPGTYMGGGRSEEQRKLANRDFDVCFAAGQRIQRCALACAVTGDVRYRDAAWRQIESLFNHPEWSDWQDQAHIGRQPADLRTGMFALDLALAYDWLYDSLTPDQRKWLVDGLDRRAIQPFWQCVERKASWTIGGNNWCTVIVGGLGVLGMSLAEDHPDSKRLIEFSRKRLTAYLKDYGREGEYNESVGYSLSTRMPVTYFAALSCATGEGDELLAGWPLEQAAIWNAYTYLPPGRYMAMGDGGTESPQEMGWFGVVGSASKNRVLKWFDEQTSLVPGGPVGDLPAGGRECCLPLWILGGDPSVSSTSPEGILPHGRAFSDHGGIVSSRTNWNLDSTPCVVYGKAGIEKYHAHHDAGQVCIDGFGQRLITDLGSMAGYPVDYGRTRELYYNSAWEGHNVITFANHPMKSPTLPAKGKFLALEFDDQRGGYWQMDLTKFYPGATKVIRTVVHLNPATVVVLDETAFAEPTDLALRWHTIDTAEPDAQGQFKVAAVGVTLSGFITRLDGPISISRGQHSYQPPRDVNRYGVPYPQTNESFVLSNWTGTTSRVLSLFSVTDKSESTSGWRVIQNDKEWQIDTPHGTVKTECSATDLVVRNDGTNARWTVLLKE